MSKQEISDYVDPAATIYSSKKTEEVFLKELDKYCKMIYDRTYSFNMSHQNEYLRNNHPYDSIERIAQDLIVRKLSNTIGSIFCARQSDRHANIRFLKGYLKSHCIVKNKSVFILRLDIRKFYPSIDQDKIIDQLRETSRLSSESIWLLEEILKKSTSGLPLGVSISAPLSEFAMDFFDKSLLRLNGIWYYNRYVDDIIIICADQNIADKIWKDIPSKLKKIGLEPNRKKSKQIIFGKGNPVANYEYNEMTYLGYKFKYQNDKLTVLISDRKINEIKRRIVASFYSWISHRDFNLLCDRLKFLTGNSRFINIKDSVPTLCGLKQNYPLISEEGKSALIDLDRFMKRLIYSKNARIGSSFIQPQRNALSRFSFRRGYESKKWQEFSVKRIGEINRIW